MDKQQIRNSISPVARIMLASGGEKPFWGPGTVQLLSSIDEMGSVRKASEKMDMSYSKAWKLLKNIEEGLGFSIAVRQQGGKSGGEAHLTDEGKEFLQSYVEFEKKCQRAVQEIFDQHYA